MLPLNQYTIEDYYKFYRTITPIIDRMVDETVEFSNNYIRFENHQLRDALRTDFQEETNLPPIAFRQFVDRMMEEMECHRIKPCEERTGVSWYEISAYLNMRQLNPGVHNRAFIKAEQKRKEEGDEEDPNNMYLFSCRGANRLMNIGIQTVGQLIEKTAEELLKVPYFGKPSLEDVRISLGYHGFCLKDDREWFENNFVWNEERQYYSRKY